MLNPFFKNTGPFNIEKLLSKINIENTENFKKDKIYNVSDLVTATSKDLTFFHSTQCSLKQLKLRIVKLKFYLEHQIEIVCQKKSIW